MDRGGWVCRRRTGGHHWNVVPRTRDEEWEAKGEEEHVEPHGGVQQIYWKAPTLARAPAEPLEMFSREQPRDRCPPGVQQPWVAVQIQEEDGALGRPCKKNKKQAGSLPRDTASDVYLDL